MDFGVEQSMREGKIAANIIICARKMKRLTQSDVTKSVGLAQSTLSRIEAGILVPSVFLWMDLTDLLDIPVDALRYGVLDGLSKTEIRSGIFENGFKVPRIYAKEKCIKVREISPIIRYIVSKFGDKKAKKMLKELGIDRDFFTCYDNQFNLALIDDLVTYLRDAFAFQANQMQELIEHGMRDLHVHGRMAPEYKNCENSLELIHRYLKNIHLYHTLYRQELTSVNERELLVSYIPNPTVYDQVKNCSQFTRDFLREYKRVYLENLPQMTFGKNSSLYEKVTVTEVPASDPGIITYRIVVSR